MVFSPDKTKLRRTLRCESSEFSYGFRCPLYDPLTIDLNGTGLTVKLSDPLKLSA